MQNIVQSVQNHPYWHTYVRSTLTRLWYTRYGGMVTLHLFKDVTYVRIYVSTANDVSISSGLVRPSIHTFSIKLFSLSSFLFFSFLSSSFKDLFIHPSFFFIPTYRYYLLHSSGWPKCPRDQNTTTTVTSTTTTTSIPCYVRITYIEGLDKPVFVAAPDRQTDQLTTYSPKNDLRIC